MQANITTPVKRDSTTRINVPDSPKSAKSNQPSSLESIRKGAASPSYPSLKTNPGKSHSFDDVNDVNPCSQFSTALFAEFIGTFALVLLGIISESSALYFKSMSGIFQTASCWGIAITVAIYISGEYSGGHLNPAVSLAMAVYNSRFFTDTPKFTFKKCFFYCIAQLSGAITAGLVNYGIFQKFISKFEQDNGLVRGERGSEQSANAFNCNYPSPGMFKYTSAAINFDYLMSPGNAFMVESFGTAILVFTIFALTNCCNKSITKGTEPFFIGLLLTLLVSAFGPLTGSALNPVRDFGPRLVTLMFGWGKVAFPGPQNGFWIYLLGPCLGGLLGGGLFHLLFKKRNCFCNHRP